MVGALAAWAFIDPPNVDQAVDAKGCPSLRDCVVSVDSASGNVVIALTALAGAALLIALLGVRFTKVTVAGATLEQGGVAAVDPAEANASTGGDLVTAPAQRSALVPADNDTTAWERLPGWAQSGLIAWANDQFAVTRPMRNAVTDSAKARGQGNLPWFVTVELDNGESLVLRTGTGRGGWTVSEKGAADDS